MSYLQTTADERLERERFELIHSSRRFEEAMMDRYGIHCIACRQPDGLVFCVFSQHSAATMLKELRRYGVTVQARTATEFWFLIPLDGRTSDELPEAAR